MRVLYPDKSWWDVYILGTMKNVERSDEKYYPVIGTGAYYNYLILRLLALNTGVEWISDYAERERIRREYSNDPGSAPDHNRVALLLGFDLLFGRFSFLHQWGFYLYAPYPARHKVYQRYGLNLRISDRFYAGIHIKAHGHVADLMDVRLGIFLGR